MFILTSALNDYNLCKKTGVISVTSMKPNKQKSLMNLNASIKPKQILCNRLNGRVYAAGIFKLNNYLQLSTFHLNKSRLYQN